MLISARSGALDERAADAAARELTARMTRLPEVASVAEPARSRDGRILMVEVAIKGEERETDVLGAVADGLTNAEIGRRLVITEATVKTHLLRLFAKLDVNDRTRAVVVAMERGLLRRP